MSDIGVPAYDPPEACGAASRVLRPTTPAATSFCVVGGDSGTLRDALGAALRGPGPRLGGAILFASGRLGAMGKELLEATRAELGDLPLVLAAGAGVLTERGEQEASAAVAGLIWRRGTTAPLFVPPKTDAAEAGRALADQVSAALGDSAGTVVLLAAPDDWSPRALDPLAALAPRVSIVGGGTLPRGAFVAAPGSPAVEGAVVGLALGGLGRPAVGASAACRLLAPLAPITEARGAMVLRLGHQPALDRLTESTSGLAGSPLVLAALAPAGSHRAGGGNALLMRGIRGVDPARKAVVVTDEVELGMLMSFGVRDPGSGRINLRASAREVDRQLAGAAPQFGLFFSCTGRGANLYGERDVDTRIVRDRFPDVPFAGMFSTFEIAPHEHRPAMHLYTGVLAMFGAAS